MNISCLCQELVSSLEAPSSTDLSLLMFESVVIEYLYTLLNKKSALLC